jgi:GT2 family glycosyltransferase
VAPPAGQALTHPHLGIKVNRMMEPFVEVVIVNYNAGQALSRCVQSVFCQQEPSTVTIIDNASTDDSISQVNSMSGHPEALTVIENSENPGFARAVNQAVRGLDEHVPYLLVLNPDCEMQPGSMTALRAALNSDPRAALAGPMVIDRDGRPMRGTVRRFPDPWKSLMTFSGLWRLGRWMPAFTGVEMTAVAPDEISAVEAVSGACMLIRKAHFLGAGGMDEAYGLHCEDLDLMYRLSEQGHLCLFVPAARVFHQQGVSSRTRPLWVHWQKHLGMQRFFRKFQAENYILPVRWLVIAGIWSRFLLTLPLVFFSR